MFWNVGAWGAAAFLALELEGTGWDAWGRMAGVAMIGIGALLAGVAFRRYLRYRLDGAATLFLLPPRPCLGEPFTILFRHAKAPADGRLYAARLRCAKHVYLGGDSSITTVWTQDHRMTTANGIAETTLSPPVHLPPSHSESGMGDSYHWSIDLDRGGYVQTYEFKLGCVAG